MSSQNSVDSWLFGLQNLFAGSQQTERTILSVDDGEVENRRFDGGLGRNYVETETHSVVLTEHDDVAEIGEMREITESMYLCSAGTPAVASDSFDEGRNNSIGEVVHWISPSPNCGVIVILRGDSDKLVIERSTWHVWPTSSFSKERDIRISGTNSRPND